ncbi:MAG: TonB-dependent receptor [Cyclobacteriaceae bacterium]|nr:TonB-dependent receptor [Cyclobacteriaceae bacterium]
MGQKRTESPVVVGLIDKKTLDNTQANTLADGLNFQSGLRMETDCQTCGYSQLRMNGLGGAYSLILIDSRPIFSSMMGLYGLEQIPASTIERIEVIRGGSSAVYGSNAIAGTVNVITREPESDLIDIGVSTHFIGAQSWESKVDAVASKVFARSGITLNISQNNREAYDANKDGFSELPKLEGTNFGLNSYYKIGKYTKLGFNLNGINEYRRGGNSIEAAPHKADQAEERAANIIMGGLTLNTSLPALNSSASFYFAGQYLKRKHYTGIDHADAYGNTFGQTAMSGVQYHYFAYKHTFTVGAEYIADGIQDYIPLYTYEVDQQTSQFGAFAQDEWKISDKFTLLAGLRMDSHNMIDKLVFNPRANLLYKPLDFAQVRLSYASGFRAPQAFDTDLHIAFAGGGVSRVQLDPDLNKETSESYSFSINYDRPGERAIYGFTIETFHTRLFDAFVLEDRGDDGLGNMILLKKNGGGSTVQGLSMEGRINYNDVVEWSMGMTLQTSLYDDPVQWSSDIEAKSQYLRTPNDYGFYMLDIQPLKGLAISLAGVYSGAMLVPHYGGAPGVPADELITSKRFFDQQIKVSYTLQLKSIGQGLQFFGGIKNISDAYQNDFDTGPYRDSNFVYGPARPRTFFFGVRLATSGE